MSKITKKCKTCDHDFETVRAHTQYCSRLCYKRDSAVKIKYADRTKAYLKKYNTTDKRRFDLLKSKCTFRKLELDISFEEYCVMLKNKCDYCSNDLSESGVGLDRKDSNKGYVKGNIVPCCGSCNQIKNVHLTYEEMKAAMKAVLELRQ